ncbi:MAG TPA: hypothetical protein VFE47_17780 [Tepidisphaeraceae bacterium]|jgi:hypothetical protein|nr:hypothetical protein [Tepidisphaeraceae bacterium]
MEEPSPPSADSGIQEPSGLVCPHCGQALDMAGGWHPVVECTQCRAQFFPPAPQPTEDLSDDEKEEQLTRQTQEDELSALHIRQFSRLIQANYRTRSYFIIGAITCLWMIMPLLFFAVKDSQHEHHWGLTATGYALFALASLMGAIRLGRRVVGIQREINANRKARELEEAEAARHEPDMSTLSDGSQRARNLEMMFGGKAGENEPGKEEMASSEPSDAPMNGQ